MQVRNPSSWGQRIAICLVASVAFSIAVYMGLYQWRLIDSVWDPVFGGETMKVLDSDVSHDIAKWILVPDSVLGALAYLGDVFFALAGSTRRWQDRPWLVFLFGISVIPVGIVSATLIALQGTVVGSWCFPCMITASISIILIFLAYGEVKFCLVYLHRIWKKTNSVRIVWDTFIGRPSQLAVEVGEEMLCGRGG